VAHQWHSAQISDTVSVSGQKLKSVLFSLHFCFHDAAFSNSDCVFHEKFPDKIYFALNVVEQLLDCSVQANLAVIFLLRVKMVNVYVHVGRSIGAILRPNHNGHNLCRCPVLLCTRCWLH